MKTKQSLQSKWYRLKKYRLHAKVAKKADNNTPTLILVHGVGISHRYFVPTGEHLAPFYTVYIPDLPGFGKSTKPSYSLTIRQLSDTLADFIDTTQAKRVILLGNSFGCQVVVDCLVNHPQKAIGAILVGPTVDKYARTKWDQVKAWFKNSKYEKFSQMFIILKDYRDCGIPRLLKTFDYAVKDKPEEKLPHIKIPVLVVRGGNDKVVSQKWAEEVTRLLPKGKLVVIPGKGHTVNYNAPEQLVKVTRQFIDSIL